MMRKLFVSRPIASKLRALGYNEPCMAYFTGNDSKISNVPMYAWDQAYQDKFEGSILNEDLLTGEATAPIHKQAEDYIREKFGMYVEPFFNKERKYWECGVYDVEGVKLQLGTEDDMLNFVSRDKALEWGLNWALTLALKLDVHSKIK